MLNKFLGTEVIGEGPLIVYRLMPIGLLNVCWMTTRHYALTQAGLEMLPDSSITGGYSIMHRMLSSFICLHQLLMPHF